MIEDHPAMANEIQVKRIYDPVEKADGYRVLVDRLWPRGVRREDVGLDEWTRDLGPSDALRRWYGHDVRRWSEFVERYKAELADGTRSELLARLEQRAREGPLTLLCAARDADHSNAAVVIDVLRARLQ